MYDIVIKNGTIIDFDQSMVNKKGDIFIKDGIVASCNDEDRVAIGTNIIDATDCIVVPGLLDTHFHAFEGGNYIGAIYPDIICPPSGVTTVVDGGTSGTLNFKALFNDCVCRARTNVKALLHPAALGVLWPAMEEPENPDDFDVKRIIELFNEHEKTLVGLKIRCNKECTIGFGTAPIKKTVEVADHLNDMGHRCVVTMHFGEVEDKVTVSDMADCLRPGDVFAHFYQPCENQTFDEHGKMLASIMKAKERGVMFDACMASSHYSFANMRIIMKENFFPDIISSDMVSRIAYTKPGFSLPYLLSIFLNEGMPLEEIFKAVTYTPAKTFGLLGNAGTLKPGSVADVAIFKIIEKTMHVKDRYGGDSILEALIVPMATIRKGAVVFQQLYFG